ncbi:MAG: pyridoxal-phosphate-dependent aminotransferase family protein [Planctomycetota bacterium]
MTTTTDHQVLFIPGPVEVDPELREIMARPLVGHRSPGFVAEVKAVCDKLKDLFLTKGTALFENAPATALMEAAVRNLVHDRILHLTCGAFSERWTKVSQSCGRTADTLASAWSQHCDPAALREQLRSADEPYEAVAITHNETSTGVINPLQELAAVVREESPDTLILVDAVTSLAGAELRFDDWGLDLAFAGTQKCLALPPGLCVYAVSDRALKKAEAIERRGWLLDFHRAKDGLADGKTVATPCVPLVFALGRQLDRIATEGLEKRWVRHQEMRAVTANWANEHNFEFFVDEPYRSPTITALRASGRDVTALAEQARQSGFAMDKGYGKLKGVTFRIGHMGDHTLARLREFFAVLT